MMKKLSRLELCRESLKRIIYNLIDVTPFKGNGKCRYCGGVNEHINNCIYEVAGVASKNVRSNKPKGKGNGPL
jgi:hypothetical protein